MIPIQAIDRCDDAISGPEAPSAFARENAPSGIFTRLEVKAFKPKQFK
jgi:hypothetical protein